MVPLLDELLTGPATSLPPSVVVELLLIVISVHGLLRKGRGYFPGQLITSQLIASQSCINDRQRRVDSRSGVEISLDLS